MARIKTIPNQPPIEKPSELPTQADIEKQLQAQIQQHEEQRIRAESADLVLGRLLGSFIRDLQYQAGEIAVREHREKK